MHITMLFLIMGTLGSVLGGTPHVMPTVGEVWPRPQAVLSQDTYMIIRPETFSFNVTQHTCIIVQEALQRYKRIMFPFMAYTTCPWKKTDDFKGYLDSLKVVLQKECEDYPYQGMDEQYEIKIDSPDAPGEASLIAQSVWGILRGLETFSQLLVPNGAVYNVNSTQIRDFPRFSFRGLMLDTSRHFLPLSKIMETLDLMAMSKFNVFHWHIVDDQSFPYISSVYPGLSELGAYSPSHVYNKSEVSSIVTYGKMRGIRVLPEFDTPGHTQSWGPSQPGLLTPCYKDGVPDGTFGPIDPINEANYNFLKTFFTEVTSHFPDHYIHLGGDEVSFDCWKSNPNISAYMSTHNITGDYSKLEEIYITKLIEIISNLPTKNGYLVWQEVFDNGVNIADDTVVHIWKNGGMPLIFKHELDKVTAAGYNTILSSCWYLNYISYGEDWSKYYKCDPQDFNGTDDQKKKVLGGAACMWGEYVDRTNLISRTWPRASVVAEKLWSSSSHTNDTTTVPPRLEEHRCRLLDRGYNAEPLWPSFCKSDIIDNLNSCEL